jgi:hypothetical protein
VIRHYIRAVIFAISVGLATIILLFAIGAARALAKPKPAGRGHHTEICHFAFKRGRLEVTCHEKRKPRPRAHA